MSHYIKALLARMLFAYAPGIAIGLILSVLMAPTIGLLVGAMLGGFGWDMTRAVRERGEGEQ